MAVIKPTEPEGKVVYVVKTLAHKHSFFISGTPLEHFLQDNNYS